MSKLQVGGVMMVMLLGLMFSSGTSWVSAEEQKKEGPGDVQERGVPLGTEGLIVQGNQLKAAPGYVLEKGANNQMMARPKAGGGVTLDLTCGCTGGQGNCAITSQGEVAICHNSPDQPCHGTCQWGVAKTKVAPPGMR